MTDKVSSAIDIKREIRPPAPHDLFGTLWQEIDRPA